MTRHLPRVDSGRQGGTGQELLPGMILSNEFGCYQAGAYGIRIERTCREFADAKLPAAQAKR